MFREPAHCREATGQFRFTTWRTEDGLPSDDVLALAQDGDGYLWIGTRAGLARFNGRDFTVFRNSGTGAGQRDGVASQILSDESGAIWIAYEGGPLVSVSGGEFTRRLQGDGGGTFAGVRVQGNGGGLLFLSPSGQAFHWGGSELKPVARSKELSGAAPIQAVLDTDGALLFRCSRNHLWRVANGEAMRLNRDWALPGEGCTGLVLDRAGRIWVSTAETAARIAGGVVESESIVPLPAGTSWQIDGDLLGHNGYYALRLEEPERDDENDADLLKWVPVAPEALPPSTPITAAHFGPSGTAWLAHSRTSLLRFDPGGGWTRFTASEGLPTENVKVLYEDAEGQLWMGGDGVGLVRLRSLPVGGLAPRTAGFNGWITCGCEAGETIWIGTYSSGLERLEDGEWTRFLLGPAGRPGSVRTLLRRGDGTVWVGTDSNGLFVIGDGGVPQRPPIARQVGPNASALHEDRSGNLWIGTSGGLSHWDGEDLTSPGAGTPLAEADIRSIVEGADGTLWFGGWGSGIFKWADGVVEQWDSAGGLPNTHVTALHVDRDDGVWIGAFDGGLTFFKNGTFRHFDAARDGLPADMVTSIAEDGSGRLWVGTWRGLACTPRADLERAAGSDPGELPAVRWQLFDESDGLPTRQCSPGNHPPSWWRPDGTLCVATYSGVGIVDPTELPSGGRPTGRVHVERVAVGSSDLPPGALESRNVQSGERVEFHYDLPSLSAPQKVRFRYRLDGYDDDWVIAGTNRIASYTGLPKGDYTFRVAACDPSGHWAESAAPVRFAVTVPVWRQAWFLSACGIAALGAVGLGARWVERRRTRAKMDRLRQRQALDAERARIARDLHDDIGAGLTCINHLSQPADDAPNGTALHEDVGQINAIATGLTERIDEIVWAVSPRHDSLENLTTYITSAAQSMLGGSGIRCRFDIPLDLPDTPISAGRRHQLYLAFKEALHNTAKHSAATEATVSVTPADGGFELRLRDNGCGFPSTAGEGEGIGNMRHRMAEIGGHCEIRERPGGGVETTLWFAPEPGGNPNGLEQQKNQHPHDQKK